jgi:hypothetical protein
MASPWRVQRVEARLRRAGVLLPLVHRKLSSAREGAWRGEAGPPPAGRRPPRVSTTFPWVPLPWDERTFMRPVLPFLLLVVLVACGKQEDSPGGAGGGADGSVGPGRTGWPCSMSNDESCLCAPDYPPSKAHCSAATVGGGVCCKSRDACHCSSPVCVLSPDDKCDCGSSDYVPHGAGTLGVASCDPQPGQRCCAQREFDRPSSCYCWQPINPDLHPRFLGYPTDDNTCTKSFASACPEGTQPVTSCE